MKKFLSKLINFFRHDEFPVIVYDGIYIYAKRFGETKFQYKEKLNGQKLTKQI